MIRILVAEDEPVIRDGLKLILTEAFAGEAEISLAQNGAICLDMMLDSSIDLVITDIRMPEMDGLKLMEIVRREHPQTLMIVLSGYEDFHYCRAALHNSVIDYLLKPVDEDELLESVRKAISLLPGRNKRFVKGNERSRAMSDIVAYLKTHFSGNVSLDILAEEFHYNPNYLCQWFKKEMGVNYIDYVNNLRVQKSKQLLLNSRDLRVEDVAVLVGFSEAKYFSRLFKSLTGTTPTAYRNEH